MFYGKLDVLELTDCSLKVKEHQYFSFVENIHGVKEVKFTTQNSQIAKSSAEN